MMRWRRRAGTTILGVGMVVSVSGCRRGGGAPQADPLMDLFHHQAQEEGLSEVETNGKRLFAHYCVTCHGDTGSGDGQNAYLLDPAPPDFHSSLQTHPSSYWRQIIEAGSVAVGRSPLCPPWERTISGADIDALVAYLQMLARPLGQGSAASVPESGTSRVP